MVLETNYENLDTSCSLCRMVDSFQVPTNTFNAFLHLSCTDIMPQCAFVCCLELSGWMCGRSFQLFLANIMQAFVCFEWIQLMWL